MSEAIIKSYAQIVRTIEEAEQRDPKLKELKENLRAATAWIRRADDNEMAVAIRSENEAIAALFQHIYG